MKTEPVEAAIEKYVAERMEQGREKARNHFLAYAHMVYSGGETQEFMRRARGLCRYYIDFLRIMENPLKGPEMAFCAAMISVALFSSYLIGLEEKRLLGLLVLSGTLFHLCAMLRLAYQKWSDIAVKIAIYREIAEIAESEMA